MIVPMLALAVVGALDSVTVTFRVDAAVPDGMPVCVVGSIPSLGGWDDGRALALTRVGPREWEGSVRTAKEVPFSFIVIRGDWAKEAVVEGVRFPEAWCEALGDTLLSVKVDGWEDEWPGTAPVRAEVVHLGKVASLLLPVPRDVWVLLPSSRGNDPSERYPVLYVHDGQDAFDARHSSTGSEWRLDEIADSLHHAGILPPLIIVAVGASPHRAFEFADTTLGEAYVRFLLHELKPRVDSLFPTMPEREHTATMGCALGGLISFLGAWWHPDVLGHAACMSPFMIWGDDKVLRTIGDTSMAQARPRARFYLSTGETLVDSVLTPSVAAACSALVTHGWVQGSDLVYEESPVPGSNSPGGGTTIASALRFLFAAADDVTRENGVEYGKTDD
ncbi:hypothetical protein JXA88_08585 [Candidatus Fermentibacteria bacterium]|nr:hypothetical protein [Candidatus Fermentibacteria bacterium]